MTIAQKRNASMQQLNSADLLPVENKNFAAEWYDSAGGQSYLSGNPAFTVNLDTERVNTAPTVFALSSDIITLTDAGLYLFNFLVTVRQNGGSSAVVSRMWLEEDPDTGVFAEVPATMNYFSTAAISAASSSGFVSATLRVGINYRYRVRLEETSGSSSLITVANASYLNIIRLFKNG